MSPSKFEAEKPTACFSVMAQAEPGTLPRILELFAKRGLVPDYVQATKNAMGELSVEIRADGVDQPLAVYVGECLRAIFTVDQVYVSEWRRADVA
jgi:acetolactate synthase regulatory subunit